MMSTARLAALDTLRSDIKAAESHLWDIAELDTKTFIIPPDRETWYHTIGRTEFGIALLQSAEVLSKWPEHQQLASRLFNLASFFVSVKPGASYEIWLEETGWPSGVWASHAENFLRAENDPSAAWRAFSASFNFGQKLDLRAARRYPEHFPDAGWKYIVGSSERFPKDDSAWISEVIGNDINRLADAQTSRKRSFNRAARSHTTENPGNISANEWSHSLLEHSTFDPRRSEWTALEIVKQLLENAMSLAGKTSTLDRLHPDNVLIPVNWIQAFQVQTKSSNLGWEEWRNFIQRPSSGRVGLRDANSSIFDYRFANSNGSGMQTSPIERRLTSIGRLLLGLLRNDHSAMRVWNMRGNELVFQLPRAKWFGDLAISSSTTQILDACLSARSAESRVITIQPDLFAWPIGVLPSDAAFDPEPIYDLNDLIDSVKNAQHILQDNQLSVSGNQPRQVIPFRLADFAAGTKESAANIDNGDGDG